MNNLTRIICTIGPSCHSVEMIKKLITAGMDVARLNFSHDPHDLQLEKMNMVRQASKELNIPVAILADIQGPKIRVAALPNGPIELKKRRNNDHNDAREHFRPGYNSYRI